MIRIYAAGEDYSDTRTDAELPRSVVQDGSRSAWSARSPAADPGDR
jgi:hypothetical protein